MEWINKLEKRFGGLAIENLALYLIGGQVIVFALNYLFQVSVGWFYFNPILFMKGEVWRIVTFLFVPPSAFHELLLPFAWYFFWIISSGLESQWGVFKFNLYIFSGAFLTLISSLLLPYGLYTNNWIALSVLFAFATLYPNWQFMMMLIIPMKIKWLAWFSLALVVLTFLGADWIGRLAILVSLANYAVYFSKDLYRSLYYRNRRIEHQKKAQELANEPFHTCQTCGATDNSNPEREFRYREGKGICSVCLAKEANTEV